MKHSWPKYMITLLLLSFFAYSYLLYTSQNFTYSKKYDSPLALKGQMVWQKYNCQSCHQMYGLGGYLGPDLTNIVSVQGKDSLYILAITQSGNAQMPAFNLSDEEKTALIEFLRSTNASGIADPRTYTKERNGMISKNGN